MYKKIMVAIDGSEVSRSVLQEGRHIANSYGATLCLVHVIDDSDDTGQPRHHQPATAARIGIRSVVGHARGAGHSG